MAEKVARWASSSPAKARIPSPYDAPILLAGTAVVKRTADIEEGLSKVFAIAGVVLQDL